MFITLTCPSYGRVDHQGVPVDPALDPATGEVLPTWDVALDAISQYDLPWHVARFGERFDAQGVLAGSPQARRCIGYLTKYLTKQVGDCHQATTGPTHDHAARLAEALRLPAVLAAVHELAAVRHPGQERPAGHDPRRLQGQGPRR
jgi:replication initiator protein RepSA